MYSIIDSVTEMTSGNLVHGSCKPVPGVQIVERGGKWGSELSCTPLVSSLPSFFFFFVNFSPTLYYLNAWNRLGSCIVTHGSGNGGTYKVT